MFNLLEDPDGAPYPEPVQEAVRRLAECLDEEEVRRLLVDALESIR